MLISNKDPSGLLVYHFQPRHSVWSSISERPSRPREPRPPQCIASYLLPDVHPMAASMGEITCRCEPTPVFEPPDYVMEDGNLNSEGSDMTAEIPNESNSSSNDEFYGTRVRSTQDSAEPYPSPTPSPIVRPGINDFRVAVITYGIRREGYSEDFIGFIAISELFKDARNRERITPATTVPDTDIAADSTYAHVRRLGHIVTPRWVVPWVEWGPKWSRFIQGRPSLSWVCYIYMNRFVMATPFPPLDADESGDADSEEDEDGSAQNGVKTYICVLDFNPNALHASYPARRDGSWNSSTNPASAPDLDHEDVRSLDSDSDDWDSIFGPYGPSSSKERGYDEYTHNTAFPIGEDVFATPITTALPYRKLHSCVPFKGEWVPMIDAERILLVPVGLSCCNARVTSTIN